MYHFPSGITDQQSMLKKEAANKKRRKHQDLVRTEHTFLSVHNARKWLECVRITSLQKTIFREENAYDYKYLQHSQYFIEKG